MNRRWFATVLILLLLSGCSRITEPAPSEALYETKPTDRVGFSSFYEAVEIDSAVYPIGLDTQNAEGFRFIGKDILIFSGYPQSVLTLLDGENFTVRQEISLSFPVSPEDHCVTVSDTGITYVDEPARELVFLDDALQESKRVSLPEESMDAVLSKDQQTLYYSTANGLWAMELSSGLKRPVKEMRFPHQEIIGIHCAGSVVQYSVLREDGARHTLFLSADDGTCLYESPIDIPLWTESDLYFTICQDSEYRELISGSSDYGPSILVTETDPISILPMLTKKLVLLQSISSDGHIVLDTYHLESGKHTSKTRLPENHQILDVQPAPHEDTLWLLCYDTQLNQDILYRWNLTALDPKDSKNYLQPRWRPDHPDWAGLAQCDILAAELAEKHGVRILLRTDDKMPGNTDYQLLPEYQVPLIHNSLETLDQVLSQYPEGFLEELAEPTGSGKMNICLVRCIQHKDEALSSLLHWDNRSEVWLYITPAYDLAQQTHRLLFNLMDSRILGVSNAYDSWDRSEPDQSAHWERIQLMEDAIKEGEAERFSSQSMQIQLRQLCIGIRDAFPSARVADKLLWEQYLTEPIHAKS